MLVLVLASTSNSFVCARAKPFNSTIANGTKLIVLVLIVLVLLVLLVLLLIVLVLDKKIISHMGVSPKWVKSRRRRREKERKSESW